MSISQQSEQVNADIPLLLAGPIIRKVEKSKVCIWISTSKDVQARIRIFRIGALGGKNGTDSNENALMNQNDTILKLKPNLQLIGEGINSPLQLGDNLYINLIIVKPQIEINGKGTSQIKDNSLEFPTNELLAYDLELISSAVTGCKETTSLGDLGLLSGENSIAYTHDTLSSPSRSSNTKINYEPIYPALPMFYIPDTEDAFSLNLLYGSCRKLHGDDEDSLIIGDKLLQDFTFDLTKRPSALFLIGDQIYADDVADPIITLIKKFSSKLLGWKEGINGIERKLEELNVGERKEIVTKYARFSTDVGNNHLLGFGEFASMYIVAWNQFVWPKKFDQPSMDDFSDSSSMKKYVNELKELEQSRRNLVGIRRLFANIPTYMICDDHEITDDWNINKKWCDDVDQSVCGNQIISNGLIAYWAFQAWGNDPESFDDDFIQKVKLYLNQNKRLSESQCNSSSGSLTSELSPNIKDGSVNLGLKQDIDYRFIMSVNWTFVAPTYPLSVFLDCRTQRTFVDEEGPPHLLSDKALDFMKSMLIKSKYKTGDPVILISPTPVFGFELAESVQRFLTSISGSYKWDLETWRSNERGFVKFLSCLANNFKPSYCIFLSGDVHYAFTMKANFDRLRRTHQIGSGLELNRDKKIEFTIPIAQLTSSPFRSNSLTNRIAAILILNLAHKLIVFKKFLFRKTLVTKNANETQMNYDYFRRLPDIHNPQTESKTTPMNDDIRSQKIHFSKHGDDKSIFEKIKVISFNLKVRYFSKFKNEKNQIGSPYAEHRLLIKPRGQSSLPVLAKNNIGFVHVDLNSKSVSHTHYFLDKDKVRNSQAFIQFKY